MAVSVSILRYIVCLKVIPVLSVTAVVAWTRVRGTFKNNVFAVLFKVMVLGVESPLCGQSKRRGHMTKVKSGTGILGIFQ